MSNKTKQKLENTGERMIPEYDKGGLVYAEHMLRYQAAVDIVKGKTVLDIASGSGYGSHILSKKADHVYGVDVEKEAVNYAKKTYKAKNLTFKYGDGTKIPLEDNSVDVVITFETIEHIKDYPKFIKELSRVLKPDGLAIVSTPNDLEFAEGNHFHVHEFEYKELTKLLNKSFKNLKPYFQATWKYVAIGDEELFEDGAQTEVITTNLAPLNVEKRLYFYILCSNRIITESIENQAAVGEHYSERTNLINTEATDTHVRNIESDRDTLYQKNLILEKTIDDIKNSKSYKLSRKIARVKNLGKK